MNRASPHRLSHKDARSRHLNELSHTTPNYSTLRRITRRRYGVPLLFTEHSHSRRMKKQQIWLSGSSFVNSRLSHRTVASRYRHVVVVQYGYSVCPPLGDLSLVTRGTAGLVYQGYAACPMRFLSPSHR